MKRNVTIFGRDNYVTVGLSGALKDYFHDPELFDILGQAKSLRLHVVMYNKTANAQLQVRVYESAKPKGRPERTGAQVGTTWNTFTVGTNNFTDITGPFADRIEVVLGVSDGASGDAEIDCELNATLIMTE